MSFKQSDKNGRSDENISLCNDEDPGDKMSSLKVNKVNESRAKEESETKEEEKKVPTSKQGRPKNVWVVDYPKFETKIKNKMKIKGKLIKIKEKLRKVKINQTCNSNSTPKN